MPLGRRLYHALHPGVSRPDSAPDVRLRGRLQQGAHPAPGRPRSVTYHAATQLLQKIFSLVFVSPTRTNDVASGVRFLRSPAYMHRCAFLLTKLISPKCFQALFASGTPDGLLLNSRRRRRLFSATSLDSSCPPPTLHSSPMPPYPLKTVVDFGEEQPTDTEIQRITMDLSLVKATEGFDLEQLPKRCARVRSKWTSRDTVYGLPREAGAHST